MHLFMSILIYEKKLSKLFTLPQVWSTKKYFNSLEHLYGCTHINICCWYIWIQNEILLTFSPKLAVCINNSWVTDSDKDALYPKGVNK